MGVKELNDLWQLVRDNEKSIAVLSQKVESDCKEIKKLREDNEKIKEIINRAIGAKTFAGVVGAILGAVFSALVTWWSMK